MPRATLGRRRLLRAGVGLGAGALLGVTTAARASATPASRPPGGAVPVPRARAEAHGHAPRRPLVVGHRGAAGLAPENTLAACALALDLGVDAVEVDVRLTADGVPILLHDATLDRTTTGHGALAIRTAAEVAALDATVALVTAERRPEPPPTLDAVLRLVRGRAEVHVELKGDPTVPPALVDAVADLLRASGAEGVTLLSFDWDALARAHTRLPTTPLGALAATWPADAARALSRLRAAGITWFALRHTALTAARLATIRGQGLRPSAWTVNHHAALRRVLALGAEAITTDRPDRLLGLLASTGSSP